MHYPNAKFVVLRTDDPFIVGKAVPTPILGIILRPSLIFRVEIHWVAQVQREPRNISSGSHVVYGRCNRNGQFTRAESAPFGGLFGCGATGCAATLNPVRICLHPKALEIAVEPGVDATYWFMHITCNECEDSQDNIVTL